MEDMVKIQCRFGPKWNEVAVLCGLSVGAVTLGSCAWGGIPGGNDVGSSDTLWCGNDRQELHEG
jgi:hypothetical protein